MLSNFIIMTYLSDHLKKVCALLSINPSLFNCVENPVRRISRNRLSKLGKNYNLSKQSKVMWYFQKKTMRFIELSSEEHPHLTLLYKTSQDHQERQRAQTLLLSAHYYSICDLAALFDLDRAPISHWQEWLADSQKAPVLRDQRWSERPATLSADQKKA